MLHGTHEMFGLHGAEQSTETARNADLLVEGRADQFQNRIALALKPVLEELDKKEQD